MRVLAFVSALLCVGCISTQALTSLGDIDIDITREFNYKDQEEADANPLPKEIEENGNTYVLDEDSVDYQQRELNTKYSDAGICEQETEVIDYHKELNQMAKNKKIVFCGGQQNFVNMLRNAQPDISYVDQCNLATCDALIANSDIVIFRVTQMSHSLYGKAKQICKARGIRFEHLPNVTSIPLTEELIYTLITKKEATGNE